MIRTCVRVVCLLVTLLAGSVVPVSAQAFRDSRATALSAAGAAIAIDVKAMGTAAVSVAGTFTGTLTFEVSNTGEAFTPINCVPPNSTVAVTTATTTGRWGSCSVAGWSLFQVRMSSYTSGTATVTISAAATGGGGGSGGGGNVTLVDGADTADVNASGQLAVTCANCSGSGVSLNEDAPFSDGASLTPAGMMRQGTPANSSGTDGDIEPLRGSGGRLWTSTTLTDGTDTASVTVDGEVMVEDTMVALHLPTIATTTATSAEATYALNEAFDARAVAVAGQLDDTASTAATENNVAPVRITSARALHVAQQGNVTVTDGAGALNVIVDSGTVSVDGSALTALQLIDNLVKAEDDASANTDPGLFAFAIRDDTLDARSGTEGDAEYLHTNANGALWSIDVNSTAALTSLQLTDNLVQAEDAVAGSAFSGVGILAVRQDSHVDLAADGDFIPMTVDADGGLRVSIVAGAASGGTSLADDADFVDGTTSGTPIGGVAESALPTTVTEGDFGWVAMTLNRALKVSLYGTDGTALTPATDATFDAAGGTSGPQLMGYAQVIDGLALPGIASTEGDAVRAAYSLSGIAYTLLTNDAGTKTATVDEDVASAGADLLVKVAAIRDDTLDARSGTEGDYEPFHLNASGALWVAGNGTFTVDAELTTADLDTGVGTDTEAVVGLQFAASGGATLVSGSAGLPVNIVAGGGSGGTALADDADFTAATTSFTPVGGFYQSAVTACTDGDTCAVAITANRELKTSLMTAIPAGTNNIGDIDVLSIAAGDNNIGNVDIVSGTVTTVSTVTTLSQLGGVALPVEDASETAAGVGIYAMGVRRDTIASSAGASGDNTMASYDSLGRQWTRGGGPCEDHARVLDVEIDTATSGNVELVALNGSDIFYVCGYNFVSTAAQTVQLISGTGVACATGETDETGPYAFAANGGIAVPNTGAVQFTTAAGAALCIELSAASQVSGIVTYVRSAAP
jgi:hypothetical protein